MKDDLSRLFITAVSLLLVSAIVPGIGASSWQAYVLAAVILFAINKFVKPVIMVLALPVNIFTMGIFTLFVNAVIFYSVSKMVEGFHVGGFWNAFTGALAMSILGIALNAVLIPRERACFGYRRHEAGVKKYRDVVDAETPIEAAELQRARPEDRE